MSTQSRNALHVLRMVLRDRPVTHSRSIASAAPWSAKEDRQRALSFFPNLHYPAPTEHYPAPSTDFLEAVDNKAELLEYQKVNSSLPRRAPTIPNVPWPTVFEHRPAKKEISMICDAIHELVLKKDYKAARELYEELVQNGHEPKPRKIYIEPALKCLFEQSDPKGFILWLKAYPRRPAVRAFKEWRSEWEPIIRCIQAEHSLDIDLISEFMLLSGKLGIAPVTLPLLIPHFTLVTPPHKSLEVMQKVSETYVKTTRPNDEKGGPLAKRFDRTLSQHLRIWWNLYIRRLIIAGWYDAALEAGRYMNETYPAAGSGGGAGSYGSSSGLNDGTQDMLDIKVRNRTSAENGPSETLSSHHEPGYVVLKDAPIATRIRQALRTHITPYRLAGLIDDMERNYSATHPTLLTTFEKRFTSARHSQRAWTEEHAAPISIVRKDQRRLVIWLHAKLFQLNQRGEHEAAVKFFGDHFQWIGIPDHRLRTQSTHSDDLKLIPTRSVIATVLGSLIATLPRPEHDVLAFHTAYLQLAKDLAPALQPNEFVNAAFIREIVYYRNPRSALASIRQIVECGFEPGERSYAKVLFGYARMRKHAVLNRLLDDMENEALVPGKEMEGVRTPKPSEKTLSKLERLLEQTVDIQLRDQQTAERDLDEVDEIVKQWGQAAGEAEGHDEEDMKKLEEEVRWARSKRFGPAKRQHKLRRTERERVGFMRRNKQEPVKVKLYGGSLARRGFALTR